MEKDNRSFEHCSVHPLATLLRCFIFLLLLFITTATVKAESYPANCRVTTTLNVRSGPGTNHTKIGKLYSGNYVVVNSVTTYGSRQWGTITHNGRTGYIATQYVTYISPVQDEVQSPQQISNSHKRSSSWGTVDGFFKGVLNIIKWAFIIICGLIIFAFKDEIIQAIVFCAMFAGVGAILFWILFDNGSLGATIGFILGVLFSLRVFLDSIGRDFSFIFLVIYSLITIPSWISNRLQFILTNPWKYLFKYISVGDSARSVLRPTLYFVQILLYIVTTPLRLVNAVYYNIFIYGITELYDLACEVLIPTNYSEGRGNFWKWIVWFPIRLLKYPVFHGSLVLIEGMVWTVMDIFIPTITMYHGTNLESANAILGCSKRNTNLWNNWLAGTFKASNSANGWGGLGVYFAPSRRVASSYSNRANGVVFIACRVSLGKIINYALAPVFVEYNTGKYGRHSELNSYACANGYDTAEWWNGSYWEYCMFDWQNRYNNPWRIRPIYVYNIETGLAQHINGGIRHWLFSKMVIENISESPRHITLLLFSVLIVIWFMYYGWSYLWDEYLWYYF